MELLLSLSKETSNSFAELMKMPMHITIGIYNALRKYLEKEAKAMLKRMKPPSAIKARTKLWYWLVRLGSATLVGGGATALIIFLIQ